MVDDLKIIKDKYGEKMMHLCRNLFPTLLETPGLLYDTISRYFYPTKALCDDLKEYNLIYNFYVFITNINKIENNISNEKDNIVNMLPEEIFDKLGYDLYECLTEEDIQKFKKYYARGEELCTFLGDRLDRCFVFFAVRRDIDNIKREDFHHPVREDEYGTSILSIQINRRFNSVSIKNRYNHSVRNPDATYSNNLEKIYPGLTKSFENKLSRVLSVSLLNLNDFEIPGYVIASDGKLYKYNVEDNDTYYCPNNIIIKNGKVYKLDKAKYILVESALIDLQNKRIINMDDNGSDCFLQNVQNINNITVTKNKKSKIINIDDNIIIEVDRYNRVIKYIDYVSKNIENNFLFCNETLEYLSMDNVKTIGDDFLKRNNNLKMISINNVEHIGNRFLYYNEVLDNITLDFVKEIGRDFLLRNNKIKYIDFPKLEKCDDGFMFNNNALVSVKMLNVKEVKNYFLSFAINVKELYLPNLEYFGNYFLINNNKIDIFDISEDLKNEFDSPNDYLKRLVKK